MHTTSRLGLDVPDTTDNESAYPADAAQSLGVLDAAALFLSGTLASRPAAGTYGRWYLATDDTSSGSAIGTAWFDNGTSWSSGWNPPSRGVSVIAGSNSTSSTSYTNLGDQVTGIVLPTNGLIRVRYFALWQESVTQASRAAIFVGSNQLKTATGIPIGSAVAQTQAAVTSSANPTNANEALTTCSGGLVSDQQGAVGVVTTGQVLGFAPKSTPNIEIGGSVVSCGAAGQAMGGPVEVFAAAGTYTISVQFKASSGSVTVASRTLWVESVPFS